MQSSDELEEEVDKTARAQELTEEAEAAQEEIEK